MNNENIFLYIRDSRGNKKAMEQQEELLKKYIETEFGTANITIYKDECGVLQERPALNRLLDDLKKNKIDWVITAYASRFYLINYEDGKKHLKDIVEEIYNCGTKIAFVAESVKVESKEQIDTYFYIKKD